MVHTHTYTIIYIYTCNRIPAVASRPWLRPFPSRCLALGHLWRPWEVQWAPRLQRVTRTGWGWEYLVDYRNLMWSHVIIHRYMHPYIWHIVYIYKHLHINMNIHMSIHINIYICTYTYVHIQVHMSRMMYTHIIWSLCSSKNGGWPPGYGTFDRQKHEKPVFDRACNTNRGQLDRVGQIMRDPCQSSPYQKQTFQCFQVESLERLRGWHTGKRLPGYLWC